ncbi:MAG: hypothetical protein BWY71_00806 [Planctomycetes bacterium ADurb.Bin412]|nr:MAG: hypothetical protein BWY71_00806 [Planctomycetes bacterium ADurb.Bin412]
MYSRALWTWFRWLRMGFSPELRRSLAANLKGLVPHGLAVRPAPRTCRTIAELKIGLLTSVHTESCVRIPARPGPLVGYMNNLARSYNTPAMRPGPVFLTPTPLTRISHGILTNILVTPWFRIPYVLFWESSISTVCFQCEFLSVFEAAGAIFRRHISIYVEDR